MDEQAEHTTEAQRDETDSPGGAIEGTGVYEIQGGIVLYDTEDPLAWVQADNAVVLEEMA